MIKLEDPQDPAKSRIPEDWEHESSERSSLVQAPKFWFLQVPPEMFLQTRGKGLSEESMYYRQNCIARHLKKCKFFARKNCKFGSKCEFLHDTLNKDDADDLAQSDETSNKDMEALVKQVTALQSENKQLELKLEEKVRELDELKTVQNETLEVNRSLVEDIDAINEKLKLSLNEFCCS